MARKPAYGRFGLLFAALWVHCVSHAATPAEIPPLPEIKLLPSYYSSALVPPELAALLQENERPIPLVRNTVPMPDGVATDIDAACLVVDFTVDEEGVPTDFHRAYAYPDDRFVQWASDTLATWRFDLQQVAAGQRYQQRLAFVLDSALPEDPGFTHCDDAGTFVMNIPDRALSASEVSFESSDPRIRRYAPEYPRSAAQNGVGGCALIACYVDASGKPLDVRVLQSAPIDEFGRESVKAVKRWRFPKGSPPAWHAIPMEFTLGSNLKRMGYCSKPPSFRQLNPELIAPTTATPSQPTTEPQDSAPH